MAAEQSLSAGSVQEGQSAVLAETKKKILQSAAATLLAYGAVDIQGKQLSGEDCRELPDPTPLQAISNSLVISSLLFFTALSRQAVEESETPRACRRNQLNLFSNELILLASLIRFALLLENELDIEEGL